MSTNKLRYTHWFKLPKVDIEVLCYRNNFISVYNIIVLIIKRNKLNNFKQPTGYAKRSIIFRYNDHLKYLKCIVNNKPMCPQE